jgi:hypothetical protein
LLAQMGDRSEIEHQRGAGSQGCCEFVVGDGSETVADGVTVILKVRRSG